MREDEKRMIEFGERLVSLFNLKEIKPDSLFETLDGTKTRLGLGRTVQRHYQETVLKKEML